MKQAQSKGSHQQQINTRAGFAELSLVDLLTLCSEYLVSKSVLRMATKRQGSWMDCYALIEIDNNLAIILRP